MSTDTMVWIYMAGAVVFWLAMVVEGVRKRPSTQQIGHIVMSDGAGAVVIGLAWPVLVAFGCVVLPMYATDKLIAFLRRREISGPHTEGET